MSQNIRKVISTIGLAGVLALSSGYDVPTTCLTKTKLHHSTPQPDTTSSESTDHVKKSKKKDEKTIEDYLNVPESVREFRKRLDHSPNADDYVLVELVPRMGIYILTQKDGSDIKHFAKTYLQFNDKKCDTLIHKPKLGYDDYITFAFNTVHTQVLYGRIKSLAERMDHEGDKVLTPLNMISPLQKRK